MIWKNLNYRKISVLEIVYLWRKSIKNDMITNVYTYAQAYLGGHVPLISLNINIGYV